LPKEGGRAKQRPGELNIGAEKDCEELTHPDPASLVALSATSGKEGKTLFATLNCDEKITKEFNPT